mgnify:CR=1 FL=1
MIIDMHTHVFPDKIAANVIDKLSRTSKSRAFTDGTIRGLLDSMKNSGVDRSVILPVATNTHQVEKINDSAAALTENFSANGIISFACIHPDFENYRAELSRVKNLGLKGVKVHPVYQGVDIDDKKFLRIFDRAAEFDLIVVTHAGLDIGFPGVERCTPKMIRRVVEAVGEFKFILAHMGGWKNWDEVAEILAGTNVFVDTAFSTGKIPARPDFDWNAADLDLLDAADFMTLEKIFGADKILFGTDSPWSAAAESIEFIKNLPLSDADKSKILGENAAKLLRSI